MKLQFYQGKEHRAFRHPGTNGRAALFLHGFMGTPANWRSIAEAFATDGWSVQVPLLPGFGADTASLAQTTYYDWLDAASDACASLQQQHDFCVLAGHSMGGALAINLAAEHKPHQMVLTAPFWHLNIPGWQKALLPIGKYIMKTYRVFEDTNFADPTVRAQFERISPNLDLDDPAVQQAIRENVTIPLGAIEQLNRLGKQTIRQAAQVTTPTLVLQGDTDDTVLPHHTQALVERLRHATLVELQGGHDLPISGTPTSDVVLDYMRQFVGEGVYAT